MKFQAANIGALQFRLLLIPPNWGAKPIAMTHKFGTRLGEGLTSIEERRPVSGGLLLKQKISLQVYADEADDWRKGLYALGDRLVGMPLWVDALPTANWGDRIYDPQKVLNWDPATDNFVIYDGASLPGTPLYPMYAPLLLGRWQKRPPADALTNVLGNIEVEIEEASPWECRIGIHSYGASWISVPDWTSPPRDMSNYALQTVKISDARELALDQRDVAAKWEQDGNFTFQDRLEIRQALTWFVTQRGAWESWSPLPAWFQPGADTGATPSNYTARFSSDTILFNYCTTQLASAQIGFIQEIAVEGINQAANSQAYLYRLAYEADTGNPELWTNFDAPITAPEGTFQPAQILHQQLRLSLKPQDEKCTFSIAHVPGSLMADWILNRLFKRVFLTLWECDPDHIIARGDPIFVGQISNVIPNGVKLDVEASLFGAPLNRLIPGWLYQTRCNVAVFSPLCGLNEAAFSSSGTSAPADLSADRQTLTIHGVTGWSGPTYPDNLFAMGIVRTGTLRKYQSSTIVSSTMTGGNLVLKMSRPLWPDLINGAGQAVTIVPGCDGQMSTCVNTFNNYINFRGEPFIPEFINQTQPGTPQAPKK